MATEYRLGKSPATTERTHVDAWVLLLVLPAAVLLGFPPAFVLFHPPFIRNIVLPFMAALGI